MTRHSRPRTSHYAPDTLPHPPTWRDEAACSDLDSPVFFPDSSNAVGIAYAKSFCTGCPVRSACLTHALNYREDYGIWGGLDEVERAELLRKARLAAEKQRRAEKEKARQANATAAA
ncbi:WhiB family transcriptional regulator [Streptomyces sp. NPDC001552]|uniref:WhiB family transcriptional regulator n=1 Tax=Streptomyces sp. NPDC001552 TaxID=3364587 RepID=UPI00368C051B